MRFKWSVQEEHVGYERGAVRSDADLYTTHDHVTDTHAPHNSLIPVSSPLHASCIAVAQLSGWDRK